MEDVQVMRSVSTVRLAVVLMASLWQLDQRILDALVL